MSLVDDQVQRLDAILDRIQLARAAPPEAGAETEEREQQTQGEGGNENGAITAASSADSTHAAKLKTLIRALSTTASPRRLLRATRLREAIAQIPQSGDASASSINDEHELEWLAIGKAAIQVYGLILNVLLDQTIPLNDSIWYWDDVLGSYAYTGLYTLQVSPQKFWHSAKEVYADAKRRYRQNNLIRESAQEAGQTLSEGWREFYGLVQQSIEDRSLAHARTRILSPFALCRTEARHKQENVKKLREQSATAIGLLVEEGLTIQEDDPDSHKSWKNNVSKSIWLLEGITTHAQSVKSTWNEFEYDVIDMVDRGPTDQEPSQLVNRLLHILDVHIPEQERQSERMTKEFGKPSRWIRYWAPGLLLFLSSGTLLRIFVNRRAEIVTWVRELGATTIDFWYNWVIEPTKRLIGTIRHDENSELAVMSKDSLRSDRESLERMVIDFAVQNPENGTPYTESQVAELRSRVRQGDLTAVLKAYEKDIQSPARGAIFGNLVRALLIQVQKTKVDVEIAMNGIDSILKSQELLFGFVGLAPGMVVAILAFRWLSSTFGRRRGIQQMQQQGGSVRLLRNIDRTLSKATITQDGMLSYKDNGLLLCDVHVLRQTAIKLIPGKMHRDFIEDLNDLLQTRQGVERQLKVLQRIQWAYSKWLR
ncbi:Nuclear control of ATPase protein 2 [Lithohypha guttulata]|uniref:Nuclear control of ATPase protein 2 n=1 Tax=Lithohypha guttulata TaxID=1690604 RepID=A0AAN7SW69_9EURO|nr:Nuclear control of ATPase protein 2 [Lithohypha guttulata]